MTISQRLRVIAFALDASRNPSTGFDKVAAATELSVIAERLDSEGPISKYDIVEILKQESRSTSQKELAKSIGCSAQFLCDLLKGRRRPTGKVLEYLGLREAITYKVVLPSEPWPICQHNLAVGACPQCDQIGRDRCDG